MSKYPLRILLILSFAALLACAWSQAGVSPEAKAFLDQLAVQRQGLPAVSLSPYQQSLYRAGGPLLTYLPGKGLRFSMGNQSYHPNRRGDVFFTQTGLLSTNEIGESLPSALVDNIQYLYYCAPFLTTGVLSDAGDTTLERDADEIRLIIQTNIPDDLVKNDRFPPHLHPMGMETIVVFSNKDSRFLELKTSFLRPGGKTRFAQWRVETWQDINGIHLPRIIRPVTGFSRMYMSHATLYSPKWTVISPDDIKKTAWAEADGLITVNRSRTVDGLPPSALPNPTVAADYARALTAWREGDLATAKKGFETLLAASPGLSAPRVRLLELQMLSDLPAATDAWIAWLKQDFAKGRKTSCPFFLTQFLSSSSEKEADVQTLLIDNLDHPSAFTAFLSRLSYPVPGSFQAVRVKKIEAQLTHSPSRPLIAVCLQITGQLTNNKDSLEDIERVTAKCRETGMITMAGEPNFFQTLLMVEAGIRAAKGTTETWKEKLTAVPNPTTEQQYELFYQYCRDREFLPAFKLVNQLMKKKEAEADTVMILPLLDSITYSNMSLTEDDKAELLALFSQNLPFELLTRALQACGRAQFKEGVNTILSHLEQNNYQDLDTWQLLRLSTSLSVPGSLKSEWTTQLSTMAKLAMERCPDDQTKAVFALSFQHQPILAETLKEYYDAIDPLKLDVNSLRSWLRFELKKAADSPEALEKLVMTLGGDADQTRAWVEKNLPEKSPVGQQEPIYQSVRTQQPVDWSDPAAPTPEYALFYRPHEDQDLTAQLWRVFKLSPIHRSQAADRLMRADLSVEEKSRVIIAEMDRGAPMGRGNWHLYMDVLRKAGKDEEIERLLQHVVRNNPSDTSALTALHGLYLKENKSAEAARLTLDYYPAIRIESIPACGDMLRTLNDDNRAKLSTVLGESAATATKDNQIRLAFALSQWDQYEKAAAIFEPLTLEKTRAILVFRIWTQATSKTPQQTTEQARIYRLQLERDPENVSFSSALYAIQRAEGGDAVVPFAAKLADTPGITIEQGVDIVSFLRGQNKYEEALAIAEKIKDAPSRRGNASYSQTRLKNEEIECLKALGRNEELQTKSIEAIVTWNPQSGDYELRQILERLARPQPIPNAPRPEVAPIPDPGLCDKIAKEITEKMADATTRQVALIQLYTVFDQLPKAEKIAAERVKDTPDWASYHLLMNIVKQSKSPDRFNRVLTLFEEAAEKNPGTDTYQAYNLVAWVFQNGENEDTIRPVWEKYGQQKTVRDNRAQLAQTAQQRGFNALAAELIEESEDDDANIMTQRVQVLMKNGQYEKALTTIDKTRAFINREPISQVEYQHQNLNNAIERSVRGLRGNDTELEKLAQAVGDPGDNLDRLRLVFNIKKTQFETSRGRDDPMRGKTGAEALDLLEKMVKIASDSLSDTDYYQLQYIAMEIKDVDRMISAHDLLIKQKNRRAKDYSRTLQVLHEINPEKALEKGLDWARKTQEPAPFLQYLSEKKHAPEKGLEMINTLTKDEPDGEIARQCRPFKATWLIATGKLAEGVALIERLDVNDVRGINNYVTSQAILDAVHQKAISLDKGITLITKVAGNSGQSAYYWNGLAQKNFGKANPLVAVALAEKAVAMDNGGNFLETLAIAQALSQSKDWRKNFQATIAKMDGDSGERIARVGYQLCQRGEKMDPVPPAMIDTILDLCQEPKLIASYGYYVSRFLIKAGKQDQLLSIYLDILRDARAIPADLSAAAARTKRKEAGKLTESIFSQLRREQSIMTQLEAFTKENPNHAEAVEMMGLEHQRRGRDEQALDAFAQVIQLRGTATGGRDYYRLALIHAKLGDVPATRKNFRKAVEIDPDLAKEYTAIMNSLAFRNQGKEAMAFATEWATVSGEIIGFLDRLNQGKPRQPERWLETAADLIAKSNDQDKTKKTCAPFQALWLLETGQTQAGLTLLDTIDKETVTILKSPELVARLIRDAAWRSGKITPADTITRIEKLLDERRLKDSYFWQNLASMGSFNEQAPPSAYITIPLLKKALALKPGDENIGARLIMAHIESRTPGWIEKMETACDQWLEKSPRRVGDILNSVCRSYGKDEKAPEEVVDLVARLMENKDIAQRCSYEARQFFQRLGDTEITVRLAQKALDTCEKPEMRFRYVDRLIEALDDSEDPGRIIPLLTAELPKITDWSQAHHLSSRLEQVLRKTKREGERAAIADKILAATPAENVIVRSQALTLKGEKKAGAKLLYDVFMADPDPRKFSSVRSALESAKMHQEVINVIEKLFDISPDSRGRYQQTYNKALIYLGRTDEVLAYVKENAKDVVRRNMYYEIGTALAQERQNAALNELYKIILAEAGQNNRKKAGIHNKFLYYFRQAEDVEGLHKAGRALMTMKKLKGTQRKSWLRTWRYAAKRTHSMPRFCVELAAIVKERPGDTILLPVLEAELGKLPPADLANALGTVDDMLLENTPEALRTNIRLLTKANRPEDALTLLAALQKNHPAKITEEDTRTLIQAHVQAGDWDAAMAIVNTWREQAPDDLMPLFAAAQVMLGAGRHPEAEALLTEAGKLAGNDPEKLIAFHSEYIRYFQRANQPTQALDYWMTTLQPFPAVTRETLPAIQKMLDDKTAYDPYLREAARVFAGAPGKAEYLESLKEVIKQSRTPDAKFALYFGILESRADIDAFTKLLTVMRRDWDSDYQVSTAAEFIRIYPAQGEKMLNTIVQVYTGGTYRATLKEGLKKELQRGDPSPALLSIQARVKADEGDHVASAKLFAQAAAKATGVLKAALGICQARALAVDNPEQARKVLAAVAESAEAGSLAETARNLAKNPIKELPFKNQTAGAGNQMNIIQ